MADMELDRVADMEESNLRGGHRGWLIGPKLFWPEAFPGCTSFKIFEFISLDATVFINQSIADQPTKQQEREGKLGWLRWSFGDQEERKTAVVWKSKLSSSGWRPLHNSCGEDFRSGRKCFHRLWPGCLAKRHDLQSLYWPTVTVYWKNFQFDKSSDRV